MGHDGAVIQILGWPEGSEASGAITPTAKGGSTVRALKLSGSVYKGRILSESVNCNRSTVLIIIIPCTDVSCSS